jgi:hypothetical protein
MGDSARAVLEKFRFYAIKLPLILVLICLGFVLDFVLQLPFALMCGASSRKRVRPLKKCAGR